SLILLDNKKTLRLNKLSLGTWSFFEKISGYDTLRLVLCKKAILVEGDSDELVVQKAYKDIHGVLPIENCVEVISVGISFLRFLEIAEKLEKQVSVVTDNDGDVPALLKKYSEYLGAKKKPYIDICYDSVVDVGALMIGGKPFNYNTLEPKLLKSNGLAKMNLVLGTAYLDHQGLQVHMRANKTECALKVFDSKLEIAYPDYILDSIK
ncbi:ATP-dependent endonuclease, partial [Pseudomonas sp. MPBD4-3]